MKKFTLSVVLALATINLMAAKPEKVNDDYADDMKLPIREIMDKYYSVDEFVFGACSRTGYVDAPKSKLTKRWLEEFSYNTPENDFKQTSVYPTPDSEWNNSYYMRYIELARENGQVIRAHGPISPQCSPWVRDDSRTAEELEEMMTTYMTRLSKDLQANNDVVKWMDVVNETFAGSDLYGIAYDRSHSSDDFLYRAYDWFGPRYGTEIWENPWPYMGFECPIIDGEPFPIPMYIKRAFEIAQQYAPDVKKIYNDHGRVINPVSYERLKKTVLYLRSEGLIVDGIGWQAHVSPGWEKDPQNVQNLVDVIEWCYANDLEFHITELDIRIESPVVTVDLQKYLELTREAQADTMAAVVEVMLQHLGKGARGINCWTMADRANGDSTIFAIMFDAEGNPTPAYYKVKELLIKYGRENK